MALLWQHKLRLSLMKKQEQWNKTAPEKSFKKDQSKFSQNIFYSQAQNQTKNMRYDHVWFSHSWSIFRQWNYGSTDSICLLPLSWPFLVYDFDRSFILDLQKQSNAFLKQWAKILVYFFARKKILALVFFNCRSFWENAIHQVLIAPKLSGQWNSTSA